MLEVLGIGNGTRNVREAALELLLVSQLLQPGLVSVGDGQLAAGGGAAGRHRRRAVSVCVRRFLQTVLQSAACWLLDTDSIAWQ